MLTDHQDQELAWTDHEDQEVAEADYEDQEVARADHQPGPDADGSVLKYHLTKWVPQFRIEEGEIKTDLGIFCILIFLVTFMFLCILRTVLLTKICFPQTETDVVVDATEEVYADDNNSKEKESNHCDACHEESIAVVRFDTYNHKFVPNVSSCRYHDVSICHACKCHDDNRTCFQTSPYICDRALAKIIHDKSAASLNNVNMAFV